MVENYGKQAANAAMVRMINEKKRKKFAAGNGFRQDIAQRHSSWRGRRGQGT